MSHLSITKKTLLSAAVCFALVGCGNDDDETSSVTPTPTPAPAPAIDTNAVRTVTLLDKQGWRFMLDETFAMDETFASNMLARGGEAVVLPHTWNATDAASTNATVPYKRSIGWYRLDFDKPAGGARQYLQFDGASITADVWLNGEKLGQHKGAFGRFRYDVTDLLKAGKNTLLVKADNRPAVTGSDPTAVAPLSGDFNMSGGLYRGVSIISTPAAAHFRLDDFGSAGVFARTSSLNGNDAVVNVQSKLKNDTSATSIYTVVAALVDADGKPVVQARKSIELAAGASADLTHDLSVKGARLWQGVADPYLYKLVVALEDSTGATLDKVVQNFGIRQMRFDPDQGFFLNGISVPLHGVAIHQDFLGKAWAVGKEEIDQSLDMVREIGANTVRMAHYPHSEYAYDVADKLGLVVWPEIPFVDRALTKQDCEVMSSVPTAFSDNLKMQLQEMIRQHYNHASIAMWGIGNEIGQGAYCPAPPNKSGSPSSGGQDTVMPLLRELNALAHVEDPSRVTTEADWGDLLGRIETGGVTDIWAGNRYYGWYQNQLSSVQAYGAHLDKLHAKYPRQPLGISEYGAGAAITDQTDNPLGSYIPSGDYTAGRGRNYQPEGYANYVHEWNYKQMASRPFIWGTYVWNMFDFGSGVRNEGDVRGVNTKGLVTFDRQTRKDPFYFYQANWRTDVPVMRITGHRYVNRAYPLTDVKIYSNTDSTTLTLNGRKIGSMTAEQCEWKICVFPNVKLDVGDNVLVAEGSRGGQSTTDSTKWVLDRDNAENIYIAAGQSTTGFVSADGHRHGSDNFFNGGTGDTWGPYAMASVQDPVWGGLRQGTFSYDIPLAPNTTYTVTLGFLEPSSSTKVGDRVFSVKANGTPQLNDFDVLQASGSVGAQITRSFSVTTNNDGKLLLDFAPSKGKALVSNIRIVRQ